MTTDDTSLRQVTLFIVGAVYQDFILHVDRYPFEDEKLRANHVTKRRGGNGGNTLCVLDQFRRVKANNDQEVEVALEFVGTFAGERETAEKTSPVVMDLLKRKGISLSHSIFRGLQYETPTAWIIATPESRTIVNYNELPDLTSSEFIERLGPVLDSPSAIGGYKVWFHFEGRNPAECETMIKWLHKYRSEHISLSIYVSVEFEKPNQPELEDRLLPLADVAFFSRIYAEAGGFADAPAGFLENIRRKAKPSAILYVLWGSGGAYGLVNGSEQESAPTSFHTPALPIQKAVDTIGAGDTFIAGVILGLAGKDASAEESAVMGCALAGTKCAQVGFDGLNAKVDMK
ncbi:hypothetical protein SeLEV6574_g04051 [Synchytrium endobioticum]|uniref:Carbohydrate kinase PfkB domain-containing protein n=1 Tax=Synchytrium endobioticum TaxID=286115 RepID=A0A507D119_9FUNG|nr:hypothetical protein SeLEV6574_g04051 [Synchytrium endobioticum]